MINFNDRCSAIYNYSSAALRNQMYSKTVELLKFFAISFQGNTNSQNFKMNLWKAYDIKLQLNYIE